MGHSSSSFLPQSCTRDALRRSNSAAAGENSLLQAEMASQVATQCSAVSGFAGARSLGSAQSLPESLKASAVVNRRVQRTARKSGIVAMVPKKKVSQQCLRYLRF